MNLSVAADTEPRPLCSVESTREESTREESTQEGAWDAGGVRVGLFLTDAMDTEILKLGECVNTLAEAQSKNVLRGCRSIAHIPAAAYITWLMNAGVVQPDPQLQPGFSPQGKNMFNPPLCSSSQGSCVHRGPRLNQ